MIHWKDTYLVHGSQVLDAADCQAQLRELHNDGAVADYFGPFATLAEADACAENPYPTGDEGIPLESIDWAGLFPI